eukprot:bmy_17180T0
MAMAMVVDVAASADWAMASEAMDMTLVMEASDMAAITTHFSVEHMDSLASIKILLYESNIWLHK